MGVYIFFATAVCIRDAKRDLNPRKFSFSFSNFEGFREQGQRLGLRIGEGNPRNLSKFENENEGLIFEDSDVILENFSFRK